MIYIGTTVLIDEFLAAGDPAAPVNRQLLRHGGEALIVPVAAVGEFLDGTAMVSEERVQEALMLLRGRRVVAGNLEVAEHYGRITAFCSSFYQRTLATIVFAFPAFREGQGVVSVGQ